MRNENFFGCLFICLGGCLLDAVSPVADVATATVGVVAGG